MASVTEEMNFQFCFILIKLRINSPMWLVATIWDKSGSKGGLSSLNVVEAAPPNGQGVIFSLPQVIWGELL